MSELPTLGEGAVGLSARLRGHRREMPCADRDEGSVSLLC